MFRLTDDWGDLRPKDEIAVYGVGRIGRRALPTLMKEFNISYLIDKQANAQKLFGLKIVNMAEALKRLKEKSIKIVVTTAKATYDDIAKELISEGLQENKDFAWFERFAGEWNLRWNNKCVLSKIDSVITSRCTLKCKNCNMFVSHAKNRQDISFDLLKQNFDTFFDSVDFVYEYTLLGGEPLLHKDLTKIISYLMENYGNKIGLINLITNGTVLPNSDVIDILKKYNVTVHISDYTLALHYEDKLQKFTDLLTESKIEHYVILNDVWKDVVYPSLDYTAKNPKEHMKLCGHSTHSVDNGRLYWCDPAFAAECFTGFQSKADDFLDLADNKKNNTKFDATLNILKYLFGDVNERGYMSICEKCAGVGKDNQKIVIAGVQA